MSRQYTVEELNQQSSGKLVALDGLVLDLSTFLQEHPGGVELLALSAGKDVTRVFDSIAHSDAARQLARKYAVGVLAPEPARVIQ